MGATLGARRARLAIAAGARTILAVVASQQKQRIYRSPCLNTVMDSQALEN